MNNESKGGDGGSSDPRWEAVESWLRVGGLEHVASILSPANTEKVKTAILTVVDQMPPVDLAAFLSQHPFFVCFDIVNGAALRVPRDGQVNGRVTFIYLHPKVFRWPADRIAPLVAHEAAHVVLNARANPQAGDENKRADDLAGSWGFGRQYSPGHIKNLQRWIASMRRKRGEGPGESCDPED